MGYRRWRYPRRRGLLVWLLCTFGGHDTELPCHANRYRPQCRRCGKHP